MEVSRGDRLGSGEKAGRNAQKWMSSREASSVKEGGPGDEGERERVFFYCDGILHWPGNELNSGGRAEIHAPWREVQGRSSALMSLQSW